MEDCKVTKEIKLTDSKREEFLEHDKRLVMIKMNIANLSSQIYDLEKSKDEQIEEMKKAAQEYHTLIENTAKDLGMDMKKPWTFNTMELKYTLEEDPDE